ncbi:MAG: hypothetical protein A2898_01305 [Candidatus Kerfeldbacteria bacterium RIFCSPLOWO2_01_FULL_48_11]|uniref:DUF1206 domain-containing protein n=1 Tax=Candidatus Kerfeldbacteria bacterium RIFCSPLOWO2_01_FULL_48_11 TaxID=1798543 RepID=A0A1G2B6U9_9BACT|nr:MAG: hypothetical protein UY34_C0022G0001 [Parcubacteria group bacterium GW2011_GWA2_48_9]KKW14419.1 MAG: hypothetical protein UY52_C0029G0007 [Parcubacteria group bacterium GW2011_GWC2_49_9]OGY84715.1 MAG: hypothetical protein A2898_01305 [Candidatus Kerfeldbacteria bacterium RIFCSPLOWO2_01_FULL_48_11]HCJ52360.1 hypothetical protein [Candidatus Kerfeldbacteria bacterium]HCM68797.1 hypothetical protein [Candidatus Kerfeldbacteria bacterium]
MRYFLGIIIIGIGYVFVWKSDWFVENFGRIDFAERHLASGLGGTRLFYKLLGIVIIIGAFLYMSGAVESMLGSIFGASREVFSN